MLTGQALAALEWIVEKSIPLTAGARDVVEAPDGKRLYVLTEQGTILVLDQKGQVEATIPGPFTADRLSVGKDGKKLYLGGKGQKTLQVVSLAERYQIDVAGSPFKGDAAAAVAVVVFSDFQ
jgi:hypothetical protein